MNYVLALETTEKYGSVALLDDSRVLADVALSEDRRSARTLAPAIDALLREYGVEPAEITLVAVVVGPGSFTGLRIGLATAKMFAYAVGAKVVGLGTHETVAAALAGTGDFDRLSVGVDAQRGDVVVRRFDRFDSGTFLATGEVELMPLAAWWNDAQGPTPAVFAGPALERWRSRMPDGLNVVDKEFWSPRAAWAGRIGYERFLAGEAVEPGVLEPVYSRRSAAEEKEGFRGGG